jgi:hypothetical protein
VRRPTPAVTASRGQSGIRRTIIARSPDVGRRPDVLKVRSGYRGENAAKILRHYEQQGTGAERRNVITTATGTLYFMIGISAVDGPDVIE